MKKFARFINTLFKTFWAAPLLAFAMFVLEVVAAWLGLFPVPYYFSKVWEAAVVLQVAVVRYQFFARRFRTACISTALLSLPAFCFYFLAMQ